MAMGDVFKISHALVPARLPFSITLVRRCYEKRPDSVRCMDRNKQTVGSHRLQQVQTGAGRFFAEFATKPPQSCDVTRTTSCSFLRHACRAVGVLSPLTRAARDMTGRK